MTKFLCLLLLLGGAGSASAQISATRYIDAQGVEVIQSRRASVPGTEAGAPPAPVPAAPAAQARKVKPDNLMYDPKLQVSAAEQARRDRDRVAILQQELDVEARKYEAAFQRAQGGGPDNKPNADDAQRINEELYERQKNIQALTAELRRARSER
jgi:hypothetical protein